MDDKIHPSMINDPEQNKRVFEHPRVYGILLDMTLLKIYY